MTNEELVKLIQCDIDKTANLELLYTQNLPLFRNICYRFAKGDRELQNDLLQTAYIGMVEAINHYELGETKFMTYATAWIKKELIDYLRQNGLLKMSADTQYKIIKLKRFRNNFIAENGHEPKDLECALALDLSVKQIRELNICFSTAISLDSAAYLHDDSETTLKETIVDNSVHFEDDIAERDYKDYASRYLWDICEKNTSDRENHVLIERYKNDRTLKAIADDEGVSIERIRSIEQKALLKLRKPSITRDLKEKLDLFYATAYRTTVTNFKRTWTSAPERIAIQRLQSGRFENNHVVGSRAWYELEKQRVKLLKEQAEKESNKNDRRKKLY